MKIKAKGTEYDINIVATKIITSNPSVRKSHEYQQVKNRLIDETMSCNPIEAVQFMVSSMRHILWVGRNVRNDELRAEFLAAYDLFDTFNK